MATALDFHSDGCAGLVFKPLEDGDFYEIMNAVEQALADASSSRGTKVERRGDSFGYRWLIFRDPNFEDLVATLNTASENLAGGGYYEQLLCAVFPFKQRRQSAFWIYNYKRRAFYPFAPKDEEAKQRETELEQTLKTKIGDRLPLEQDVSHWFPLWGMPFET